MLETPVEIASLRSKRNPPLHSQSSRQEATTKRWSDEAYLTVYKACSNCNERGTLRTRVLLPDQQSIDLTRWQQACLGPF